MINFPLYLTNALILIAILYNEKCVAHTTIQDDIDLFPLIFFITYVPLCTSLDNLEPCHLCRYDPLKFGVTTSL